MTNDAGYDIKKVEEAMAFAANLPPVVTAQQSDSQQPRKRHSHLVHKAAHKYRLDRLLQPTFALVMKGVGRSNVSNETIFHHAEMRRLDKFHFS